MSNIFFETQDGGMPIAFQHFIWIMGQAETWITLVIWLILIIGIVKFIKRLWKTGRKKWMIFFIISAAGLLSYYIWLSIKAYSFYAEGRASELIALQNGKRLAIVASLLSLCWILLDKHFSKRRK